MAHRTIHLPATCPSDSDHREACATCLRERLVGTPGIREISLKSDNDPALATVELSYDPRLITLGEIDAEVSRAGACLLKDRVKVVLGVDGMVSTRSEQMIESALSRMPGVVASASFPSRSLRVEFDRTQCALPEIVRRLDELGLRVRSNFAGKVKAPPPKKSALVRAAEFLDEYHELSLAIIGGLFLLAAVITRATGGPPAMRYAFVAIAAISAGWYTSKDTFSVLRQFRFDIDVLMFAAAIGAALIGNYEEGAFLLVLFAFGGAGEELAMDRARKAIEALSKLAPETATLRDEDGKDRLVRVEDLKRGDRVVVHPFDRIPADGTVDSGASAVDQSPITGESAPIEKIAGAPVFAGTINGEGLLVCRVTKLSSESTLARIVELVNEAQTTKSPTQVFTDRVEHWYVPFVLIATALMIVVPPLLGLHHRQDKGPWAGWFYQAMAFLTAASPCALALGTPAAVLSGIARAARIGVLVKGGVHLENLGRVRVIAFDKTGTLTAGRPEVSDIIPFDGRSENDFLTLAVSVERSSTHPLARAIVDEARARSIAIVNDDGRDAQVQEVPGMGIVATLDGRRISAGRPEMFTSSNGSASEFAAAVARLSNEGKSLVAIGVDDHPIGIIALSDRPRDTAPETLRRLRALGIERNIMLTGDRKDVAERIAQQIGIDEVHADLLPEQKLQIVRDLQKKYGPIAMVGDGVNDAPALATATVGIAMGGAGTDVAIETADVALMADDLRKLPDAIGLSRFSRRIIKQNLAIALGVIGVLAPLSALGFTYLGIAVLFHEGSTIVVVLNAMRLLVYRVKR